MKKSNSILLVAIVLFSTAFQQSQAQLAFSNSRTSSVGKVLLPAKPYGGTTGTTNLKAEKNFNRNYAGAVDAEWSTLSDKSLVCRFFRNNILRRAYYTANGHWVATVSGYDAARLDKDVYDQVKMVYYNSNIGFVNQVDLAGGKTYYIVEVRDEKTIKKLRVDDDGIEVVQELEKN